MPITRGTAAMPREDQALQFRPGPCKAALERFFCEPMVDVTYRYERLDALTDPRNPPTPGPGAVFPPAWGECDHAALAAEIRSMRPRRNDHCPTCDAYAPRAGILLVIGALAGALLTAVACAATWPGLFA